MKKPAMLLDVQYRAFANILITIKDFFFSYSFGKDKNLTDLLVCPRNLF